ncbi:unnamed protein product [Rotaria sordida]|uniref:Uncharacterized protein n=1 Tax=Rotaria sordida TaxID=392033 RepID=A0A815G7J3_9BILA|nr:unnamed protein product [Rotaria sordida]
MVYNTYYLLDNALPHLRHLTLKHCNCYQLSILFNLIPNLHSLDIVLSLGFNTDWSNNIPLLTHLRKFVLNSYGEKLTMIQIKQLLSRMPNLRHFELDTQGYMDLIDGQQWELLVSHLIVFDFRIYLLCLSLNISEENILESFRSLFWLEYKHWLVAYNSSHMQHIFTVPRFASNIVMHPYIDWPPSCTSSNFDFDQYITCLHLSSLNSIPHRFTNITSLIFGIEETIINSRLVAFLNLVKHIPFLNSISFRDLSVLKYMPNDIVFKQIRNLYVRDINTRANIPLRLDINQLCNIFPLLERLSLELTSRQDLLLLIDQLRYLSIAKFGLYHSSSIDQRSFRSLSVTRDWLMKNSRRLKTNNNFTYKLINNKIHLWMNNEKVCFVSLSRNAM